MIRNRMTAVVATAVLATAAGGWFNTADAQQAPKKKPVAQYTNSAQAARAQAADPAGLYRGYPDWARQALSAKQHGR
jgi:hypothetical protein